MGRFGPFWPNNNSYKYLNSVSYLLLVRLRYMQKIRKTQHSNPEIDTKLSTSCLKLGKIGPFWLNQNFLKNLHFFRRHLLLPKLSFMQKFMKILRRFPEKIICIEVWRLSYRQTETINFRLPVWPKNLWAKKSTHIFFDENYDWCRWKCRYFELKMANFGEFWDFSSKSSFLTKSFSCHSF